MIVAGLGLALAGGVALGLLYVRLRVLRLRGSFSYLPCGASRLRVTGLEEPSLTRLSEMPRFFLLSLLMAEDRHFLHHSGFDPHEMRIALSEWWHHHRPLRGASTLSQQLSKNLFLDPHRTLRRKLVEAVYTVFMERLLTKSEILTLYLNNVEWGPEIFGISAAARRYFAKRPADLDELESLFLIAALPRPRAAYEGLVCGQMPAAVSRTFRALVTYSLELRSHAEVRWCLGCCDVGIIEALQALDLKALQFGGDALARRQVARQASAVLCEGLAIELTKGGARFSQTELPLLPEGL